jgi:DNA-binding protein H-NS
MSEPDDSSASTSTKAHPVDSLPVARKARRPSGRWAFPLGALVAGLVLGGAMGASIVLASSDPTQTDQYRALQGELKEAEERVDIAEQEASVAREASQKVVEDITEQRAALAQQEAEIVAREQAVTAVEQMIAANSIGPGIWTVGVDVEPGTYRASQPVSSDCYWAITRSGTNGSDIIDNDIPGGGMPTVTLSAGQDFVNNRCGTFVKQ